MAAEVIVPITVPDTSDAEKEAYRVINDNFLLFSRRLNDMRAWITSAQYYEIRNTYVFSDQDSLDVSYPFEMDFEIVSEMTSINSVKLSFRIREFRAYSTAVPSGGGHTTAAGGGHTTPSGGGHTTVAGGGTTSGAKAHGHPGSTAGGGGHNHYISGYSADTGETQAHTHGYFFRTSSTDTVGNHDHSLNIASSGSHNHSCPSHQHAISDHQHTVSDHTHTVANHTHSLTFGIYEDSQSPTLHYHIDNGSGYGDASGDYTTDQLDLDITSSISGVGFKRIKFDSDVRCRISSWVLCKVDLTA